jgi:hypothetical protein
MSVILVYHLCPNKPQDGFAGRKLYSETDALQEPLNLHPLLLDLVHVVRQFLAQRFGQGWDHIVDKGALQLLVQPADLRECSKDGICLSHQLANIEEWHASQEQVRT